MSGHSFISDRGAEWETRKISVVGAVRSFITQLSIGQDMTRVSLPSVFLYPYSILELGGDRALSFAHTLMEANRETDSLKRMICIVKWFFSFTQKDRMEKKPYNPILGETHYCWVEDEKYSTTSFYAEQVSHHPPVSASYVVNKQEQVQMHTNVTFGIQFHGNSVTVKTQGPSFIEFSKHGETYVFSKSVPDVAIKNVIIGTKRISWSGKVSITCPESGYQATMDFSEEGWYCVNVVKGTINKVQPQAASQEEGPIYEPIKKFYGPVGEVIKIHDVGNKEDEQVLLDAKQALRKTVYYLPLDKCEDRSSLKLWHEVSLAIIDDDMLKADNAKREIEDAQRQRRNAGTSYQPVYFAPKQLSRNDIDEMWLITESALEAKKMIRM